MSAGDPALEADAADLSSMTPGVDESSLDRSADPCDDFYQFACGGFIASQPADTVSATRFGELRQTQSALFVEAINAVQAAPRNAAERKAAGFHASCLASNDQASSTAFVQTMIPEIEAATTGEQLGALLGHMQRRGAAPFFGSYGGSDTHRQGRTGTLMAVPSGFDWGTQYEKPEVRAERVALFAKLFAIYEPTLSAAEANKSATAAVDIEATLRAAAMNVNWDAWHPLGKAGLAAAAPRVDWTAFFRALGAPANLGDFDVMGLEYFGVVDGVLASAPIEAVQAYLKATWYRNFDYTNETSLEERAQVCRGHLANAFGDVLEPRFLEAAGVDAPARAKARALFRAIIDAFTEQLKTETFLDVPTRIEAQIKAQKMRAALGGSKTLDDYSTLEIDPNAPFVANNERVWSRVIDGVLASVGKPVSLLDIDSSAETVNAFYQGNLNKVEVPAGILGGFYFSPAASKVANLAAIGSVLGHELTHGFDTNGRHSDGDGVQRDWWSPSVATAYEQRASCLADQYSAFTLPGVPDPVTGAIPAHVDGKNTLAENIADNGGIKLAYRAAKVDGLTEPRVAGFTPPQQFFIGFSQLWCAKKSPEAASQQLVIDSHSPSPARGTLPVANFEAFATAFQCKPGSRMAPANRCSVW